MLGDIIVSGVVPVVRLTEIFRQAQQSGIVRAAHAVHRGELPESASATNPGDFYFIEANDPPVILERIVTLLRDRIPARFGLDPLRDVQVLTPTNRFNLGARNLNMRLQEVFNPPRDGPQVARFGWTFRIGDKVLQTANNYQKEVFNGDIGRVRGIDEAEEELHVDFDGRPVSYEFDELDELALAYALTVHKSQGRNIPRWSCRYIPSTIGCCCVICSTRRSRVASGSWGSWAVAKRRRWRSGAARRPSGIRRWRRD